MLIEASGTTGSLIRLARRDAGLTQHLLARLAGIGRIRLVRIERGTIEPTLKEVVQLACVLKSPLERFISGRWRPRIGLRGIAFELFRLGVVDLEISNPIVPGAFRRPEQVIALALRGDRPEPRVIEAVPFILARTRLEPLLALSFAKHYDPRGRHRLAWLCDVALALAGFSKFPIELASESELNAIVQAAKRPAKPDSLGHPAGKGKLSPISRRWNVTYDCSLNGFLNRAIDLNANVEQLGQLPEIDE